MASLVLIDLTLATFTYLHDMSATRTLVSPSWLALGGWLASGGWLAVWLGRWLWQVAAASWVAGYRAG